MAQIFQPTERIINPETYRKVLRDARKPDSTVEWSITEDGSSKVPPIKLKKNAHSNWDVTTWPSSTNVPANSRINMTRAMTNYDLLERDLKDLCYVVGVSARPDYKPPHEYLLTEVVRRAWEKHGGQPGLKYALAERKRKQKEKQQKKKALAAAIEQNAEAPGGNHSAATTAAKKTAKKTAKTNLKAPAYAPKEHVPRKSPSPIDDDSEMEVEPESDEDPSDDDDVHVPQHSSPERSTKKTPSSSSYSTPQKVPVASSSMSTLHDKKPKVPAGIASPPMTPRKFPMDVSFYMDDIDNNWKSNIQAVAGPSRTPYTPSAREKVQPYPTPPSTFRRSGKVEPSMDVTPKDELSGSVIDLTLNSSGEDKKISPKFNRPSSSRRAPKKMKYLEVIDISD